jgi:hypothetical protein
MNKKKNMNYSMLKEKLCDENEVIIDFYTEVPRGWVLYNIGKGNVVSLSLLKLVSHGQRHAVPHLANETVVISKAFFSKNILETTLYCGWLADRPNIVCFWERSVTQGLLYSVNPLRFVSECEFISQVRYHNETAIDYNRPSIMDCCETFDIDDLNELFVTFKRIEDVAIVNYYNEHDEEEKELINEEMFHLCDMFQEVMFQFDATLQCHISNACYSDKLNFAELKSLWESKLYLIYENEGVLCLRNKKVTIPDWIWIRQMWMFVTGCPFHVKCAGIFLENISNTIRNSSISERNYRVMERKFENMGCRKILSKWLSWRLCNFTSSFVEDVRQMLNPLSWNSFLCISTDDTLCYTHFHANETYEVDNVVYEEVQRNEVKLYVDKNDSHAVKAMPFNRNDDWSPGDFARYVFDSMQKELNNQSNGKECVFYGHCCSEQSIIAMSKTGLSPNATYKNCHSSGHGMYFFLMKQTTLTFDSLSNGEGEDDEIGKLFRGFVYAILRPFESPDCHALSPAVLLFMMSEDVVFFDIREDDLPLVQDNGDVKSDLQDDLSEIYQASMSLSETNVSCQRDTSVANSAGTEMVQRWVCSCKKFCCIDEGNICLDRNNAVCARDILSFINLVQTVEKKNMIAIIAGVVDYETIPNGAYVGNVSDQALKASLMPLQSLRDVKNCIGLKSCINKWKTLIDKPVEDFFRPYVSFDSSGRFVSRKGLNLLGAPGAKKTEMQQQNMNSKKNEWSSKYRLTIDVPEYVFVTQESLIKLITGSNIFVAFVNSIEGKNGSMECFREDIQPITLTDDVILNQPALEEFHPYWILRKCCKFNSHL